MSLQASRWLKAPCEIKSCSALLWEDVRESILEGSHLTPILSTLWMLVLSLKVVGNFSAVPVQNMIRLERK